MTSSFHILSTSSFTYHSFISCSYFYHHGHMQNTAQAAKRIVLFLPIFPSFFLFHSTSIHGKMVIKAVRLWPPSFWIPVEKVYLLLCWYKILQPWAVASTEDVFQFKRYPDWKHLLLYYAWPFDFFSSESNNSLTTYMGMMLSHITHYY
jgi:hypothetical protein